MSAIRRLLYIATCTPELFVGCTCPGPDHIINLMLNGAIIQVMIFTHNKYDDHTQMMSNDDECRVRCGG